MAFRPGFGAPPFGGFSQSSIYFNPVLSRPFGATPAAAPVPTKSTPVTTVFIGNISEKCTNEFMQQMLQECGTVTNWKRIQGSNGKFQAFGFCDYESPEGTLRALRVLNDFQIGDKKLVVKAEDKVKEELRTWAVQHRKDLGKAPLKMKEGELPADDDDLKKDEDVRLKILNWIESDHPELLTLAEDGELSDKDGKLKKDGKEEDKKKDDDRRRRRSKSRSRSRDRRRRSRSTKRSSDSSSSSRSRSRSDSPRRKRRDRSSSRSRDSEDSDDARERRLLKKQIKEKEAAYMVRLRNWEKRERERAKVYEKEERKEKERKKTILKEAKRLKSFLEDYDDEKNDPKYYKSSYLFQRRREFEKEREADAKDRLREQNEIEELKRQILAENKNGEDADAEARRRHQEKEDAELRRLRADSGSPNPHQKLGQGEDGGSTSSSDTDDDEKSNDDVNGEAGNAQDKWRTVDIANSNSPNTVAPVKLGASSPVAIQPPKRDLTQRLNGVFGVDDEDDDANIYKRKRLKPFEITQEDRMASLTDEEKKKMVRDLISRIPTGRDDLFAFNIDWTFVDKTTIDQRVRPWVSKKINEFIGEEEPALCDFICDKITRKTAPNEILNDIAMILDDDAEVFMVKMWRLLIYESEAKKLGLPKLK
ncbi:unnamed protein product [Auanema sp. JU1783]|nr:unnamed protein product [Auanema sp. JU1783]